MDSLATVNTGPVASTFPRNFVPSPPSTCTRNQVPVTFSRRGSTSGLSCAEDGDENDAPRPRLTREQAFLLEKQFNETPKPTAAIRWSVAQKTGLSTQRVGNWFQNRRAKAKLQKRQEELQVMQVLESAGRRSATEPSSPSQPQEMPNQKVQKNSGRRRAKSDSSTARLNTTVRSIETPSYAPDASPTEASYAPHAPSLAQAAAAVRQASCVGGFGEYNLPVAHLIPNQAPINFEYSHFGSRSYAVETPWQQPASAFSDWGSSRNSIAAYTPTPSGQKEDPFEYDNQITRNQTAFSPLDSNKPTQDDYDMFAAAIEMNQYNRPFIMPSFPTNSLMRRRQMSPLCAEPQNSSSLFSPFVDRRDSCPPEFVDSFSAFNTRASISGEASNQSTDAQPSLAARRKQACPSLLGSSNFPIRSNSIKGALPVFVAAEEKPTISTTTTTTINTMRRHRSSVGDTNKRAKVCTGFSQDQQQQAPFNLDIFNNLPTAENASSPKFTPLSSPGLVEPSSLGDACAAASCVKQDRIPDLGFIASSATPESGTFDDHTAAVAALPDSYQMHMPEHQLFRHTRLAQYYDFPSEGSSASSGILLGKETNAFPFEEFLSARLSAAAAAAKARPLECTMSINKQTSMVYN